MCARVCCAGKCPWIDKCIDRQIERQTDRYVPCIQSEYVCYIYTSFVSTYHIYNLL